MPYSSRANGVEAMMSGKSETLSASSFDMEMFPSPSMEAIPIRLLLDEVPDSGDSVTVTVYSRGMLKAIIKAKRILIPTLL